MTNSEQHERLCSILAKLVPCDEITTDELADLSSALGIRIGEFYTPAEIKDFFDDMPETEVLEVIEWERKAA